MTDYGRGIAVLNTWASAGGVNAAKVRENFLAKYGVVQIESTGKQAANLSFGEMQNIFASIISEGASKESPTMADINTGLLRLGGKVPTVTEILPGVLKDVSLDIFSGAKSILLLAGILGVAYILYETGALRKMVKRAA